MMLARTYLVLSLLVLAFACGDKKEPGGGSSGGESRSSTPVNARDLDPLTAVFDECSLVECRAVAAALVKGLAEKRYTRKQVADRLAFLGSEEIDELQKSAPGLVPENHEGVVVDQELARIRKMGFAKDETSLAELEKLAAAQSERPRRGLMALAALGRRGDLQALARLKEYEDVESLTLWLDVVREKGVGEIVGMFLGSDPIQFERALQLVEQLEERAFEGMVDPRGFEIGVTLQPKLLESELDMAHMTAIVTSVPGCRTAELAHKVLNHPEFPQLLRLVEERGRLMDLLALIETVDGVALRIRLREASESGDRVAQGFWLARRLDMGDIEVVDPWVERLEDDSVPAFFPGYPALARTKAPGLDEILMRLLDSPTMDAAKRIEIYQALAVYSGLPLELGFPSMEDLSLLGEKQVETIYEQIKQGRAEEALMTFLDAWDFKNTPRMELFPLGRIKNADVQKKLRALATDRKLGLGHELLGALAASGDKEARTELLGFLRAGILGFRERVSPLCLTLGTDIETLSVFLSEVGSRRVLTEKLMMDVLPLFGIEVDNRTLPVRRLVRYELSGGRLNYSRIAGGPILGPEDGK